MLGFIFSKCYQKLRLAVSASCAVKIDQKATEYVGKLQKFQFPSSAIVNRHPLKL